MVRPGRLLSAIHGLRRELLLRQGGGGGSSGGCAAAPGAPAQGAAGSAGVGPLLKRLNQIQIEATLVLDEMQRGRAGSGGVDESAVGAGSS